MDRSSNLLDVALGLDQQFDPWPLGGKVVLIEDCVETSGSFVLHQLMKRALSSNSSNALVLLALAHPFSHYDRILRKLGCNLSTQRANNRLFFFDLLMMKCPDGDKRKEKASGLAKLYGEIQNTICGLSDVKNSRVTIMIDDMSLMEVAANGDSDHVLDFLHYCHTLTSESICSLVILNHGDIYSSVQRPWFVIHMVYLADILIKAEPLATGLANDVHGQLTLLNKGLCYHEQRSSRNKLYNFHFKVKENGVEYFYPGSRN